MARGKALTFDEFQTLALENYYKGGDSFFECWDKKEFEYCVKEFGAITKTKALKMFRDEYAIEREWEAARKWYAGEE